MEVLRTVMSAGMTPAARISARGCEGVMMLLSAYAAYIRPLSFPSYSSFTCSGGPGTSEVGNDCSGVDCKQKCMSPSQRSVGGGPGTPAVAVSFMRWPNKKTVV